MSEGVHNSFSVFVKYSDLHNNFPTTISSISCEILENYLMFYSAIHRSNSNLIYF